MTLLFVILCVIEYKLIMTPLNAFIKYFTNAFKLIGSFPLLVRKK